TSELRPPTSDLLMRIVLCYPVERRHIEQIAAAAPGCEVVDAGQERIATEIVAADIFCGHAKVPMDWDAVVRAGRLRWIQSSAAGRGGAVAGRAAARNAATGRYPDPGRAAHAANARHDWPCGAGLDEAGLHPD